MAARSFLTSSRSVPSHIPRTVPTRKHDLQRESIALDEQSVASYDAILIATAHTAFDYELLADHAALIVDTRGVMVPFADRLGERLGRIDRRKSRQPAPWMGRNRSRDSPPSRLVSRFLNSWSAVLRPSPTTGESSTA